MQAVTGFAGAEKPAAAHRANPADLYASAIGGAFERLRFISCEPKTGDGERNRKRTARQALTLGTVACIDQPRGFADLVADFAAQATAGLWKFHLFGGGPRRRSGLAQHRFSRRGDTGASEKAWVLAAEQAHHIGEREVAEIGRGRQPVLDHLIGLGHDLGHVRHVEMADIGAEDRIEPGAQWIGARIEGPDVRRVVGLAAEIEWRYEEVAPVLLLADLAGAVVVEIDDAAGQFFLAWEELAALPLQHRSERLAAVLFGEVQKHGGVDIARVDLFQALEAALLPMTKQVAVQQAGPA